MTSKASSEHGEVEKEGNDKRTRRNSEPSIPPGQRTALQDSQAPLALSFSGAGFLGIYHFGTVAALRKLGPGLMSRVARTAGSSAGSMVAALIVCCPDKLDHTLATLYKLADEVNALQFGAITPGFSVIRRLGDLAEEVLPEFDNNKASKVYISMTCMESRINVLNNRFTDKKDFVTHLLASCYIPVYAGIGENPPKILGKEYADGGLSNNLPRFNDVRTITVSPFSGDAEISPRDTNITNIFDWSMTVANQVLRVNVKNVVRGAQALFPPKRATLERYYEMGYKDAMRFLLLNGLLQRPEGSCV